MALANWKKVYSAHEEYSVWESLSSSDYIIVYKNLEGKYTALIRNEKQKHSHTTTQNSDSFNKARIEANKFMMAHKKGPDNG